MDKKTMNRVNWQTHVTQILSAMELKTHRHYSQRDVGLNPGSLAVWCWGNYHSPSALIFLASGNTTSLAEQLGAL